MYIQSPSSTKCCFCVPLRYGLLTWAYIRLVFNILATGFALIFVSTFGIFFLIDEFTTYILALIISVLMLFLFDVVFNFVLIVGCHKKHTTLLRLYFRFGKAYAIVFVMLYVIIIAFDVATCDTYSSMWKFIGVLSSICSIILSLHMYLLMMVRSEILNLKMPSSQYQFVNRIADPSHDKQGDFASNNKITLTENFLPPELLNSKNVCI